MSNLEVTTLTHLLSQLNPLDSIQTGEIEEDHQLDFVRAILKHQSGVKHLELRNLSLDWRFLDKLGALKTLIGRFDPSEDVEDALQDIKLAFELDRFVSYSSLTNKTLERILQSSWSSLTVLAFAVNPDHVHLDLQRLGNLNTLRIVVEDDKASKLEPPLQSRTNAQLEAKRSTVIDRFIEQIRSILRSAQSLPIKTLHHCRGKPYPSHSSVSPTTRPSPSLSSSLRLHLRSSRPQRHQFFVDQDGVTKWPPLPPRKDHNLPIAVRRVADRASCS